MKTKMTNQSNPIIIIDSTLFFNNSGAESLYLSIFLTSLLLLLYTYIFYPYIIRLISFFIGTDIHRKEFYPRVSMIISAYNEKEAIEAKIVNSLSLDYPLDNMQIIIASDCSNDGTDEIVLKYQKHGVKLARLPERGGKTAAQNYASDFANGEILIFTDAKAILDKQAIKSLVRNFDDKSIGCAGGRLVWKGALDNSKNTVEIFDQNIKEIESRIYSTIGVDGCIYAIRKTVFEKIPENLTSDLVLPLLIVRKGYRTVFEKDAICFVKTVEHEEFEFKRKIRTVRAGLFGIYYNRKLLNPFKYPQLSFFIISKKILRWMTPIFLSLIFITNAVLLKYQNILFYTTFMMQVIFYTFALSGIKLSLKIFQIPFRFSFLAIAAIVGWYQFITGVNVEIWERE